MSGFLHVFIPSKQRKCNHKQFNLFVDFWEILIA